MCVVGCSGTCIPGWSNLDVDWTDAFPIMCTWGVLARYLQVVRTEAVAFDCNQLYWQCIPNGKETVVTIAGASGKRDRKLGSSLNHCW